MVELELLGDIKSGLDKINFSKVDCDFWRTYLMQLPKFKGVSVRERAIAEISRDCDILIPEVRHNYNAFRNYIITSLHRQNL
ncbi:MAG: hypothetical protein ABIH28_01255 [archaeon]